MGRKRKGKVAGEGGVRVGKGKGEKSLIDSILSPGVHDEELALLAVTTLALVIFVGLGFFLLDLSGQLGMLFVGFAAILAIFGCLVGWFLLSSPSP
mmetsp:Transcript_13397/g.38099  ORF Transcript_13397/g.38099 Transcript_13397/m.38099 type:complete len:96 (+) Transcript_13397:300-587(+)